MFLVVLLAASGLAPGVYTAVRLHAQYGWVKAALAGVGVTVLGVVGLLSTLILVTPLAAVAAGACLLLALRAYDQGRVFWACWWTAAALLFAPFAGWRR